MGKAILRYRYYELVCKLAGRTSKWFPTLAKYVRAPRDKMRFVMIPIEKRLDAPKQQLLPMDVVDALVERASDVAIIHQCMCRVGGNCKDYPQDIGCIALGPRLRRLTRASAVSSPRMRRGRTSARVWTQSCIR
jgi:hypothetical protein